MHTRKSISIIFLLLLFPIVLNAQKEFVGFNYPFKKGDIKWKMYNNPHDRIKALQIPQDILSELPTDSLLNICLDFPYLSDILIADNDSLCIEVINKEFNGFYELTKRVDYVKVLLDKALKLSDKINSSDSVLSWIQSIQYFVLSNLLQREAPIILSDSNLKLIYERVPFIGMSHYEIYSFIRSGITGGNQEQLRMGPGYNNVTIYTPKYSVVPDAGVYVLQDFTQDYKQSINNEILNNYDDVEILGDATKKYNCHGYAWHMTENGDTVWIDTEEIYWQDGSYIEVPESFATKVSYYGDHSAVRLNSTWYVSKWGDWSKVKHHPNIVPSLYMPNSTKHYYIRTPQITGSSIICSTAIYTIQNLPSSASVQWSVSNSNLSLISGQGTGAATFQKNANGSCVITAQVTIGTTTLNLTKNVWAGMPTAPSISGWPHTNMFLANSQYQLFASTSSLAQASEYQWDVVSGATITSGANTNGPTFTINSSGTVRIGVRARNACGWGPYTYMNGGITNDNGQTPINSPGNNIVNIPLPEEGEYEIMLWNTNRLIRTVKTSQSSYDVDLNGLPSDLYIIKVIKDGQSIYQLKVKK
jgi:hypothetical protein